MTRYVPIRPLAALALVLPLAGCISFAAKPPASLLTLTSTSAPPVDQTVSSATSPTISIQVPVSSSAIATQRVPVQINPTSFAYVKDALWSEQPARLFARLMSDTIAARTGRVVLSAGQALGDPGAKLSGELRTFGVDASTDEAVVVYEASLRRGIDRVYEKRRFEGRAPVRQIDARTVGPALDIAANKVAVEVADWVGK